MLYEYLNITKKTWRYIEHIYYILTFFFDMRENPRDYESHYRTGAAMC